MDLEYDRKHSQGNFEVYVFRTGRWKQNTYIIHDLTKACVYIVDPGGEAEKIIRLVAKLEAKVECICLTHAHHDHVGALKAISEKFEQRYFIHKNDFKLLKRAPFYAFTFETRKMDIPISGESFLSNESHGIIKGFLNFIHTPGHTKGGVVVHFEKLAFTGDTLLNKMIGRTDLPGSSIGELASSINHFLGQLADDVLLFPGHGDPWTVGEAKAWWAVNMENTPEYREE